MAADLSQDAVLRFLQSGGGSVRNADLLLHFSGFIRDHPERDRNRELFKKFVNSVATVKQSTGVSYVVLRNKFRAPNTPPQMAPPHRPAAADTRWYKVQQREEAGPAPPGQSATKTILPAAGILVKSAQQQVSSTAPPAGGAAAQAGGQTPQLKTCSLAAPATPQEGRRGGQQGKDKSLLCANTPVWSAGPQHREPSQQGLETFKETLLDPSLQSPPEPPQHSPPSRVSPLRIRHRHSYKTAVSYDEDEQDEEEQDTLRSQPAWPPSPPVSHTGGSNPASSPSINHSPAHPTFFSSCSSSSSERTIPKISIQDMEGETLALGGPGWGSDLQTGHRGHCAAQRQQAECVPGHLESGRRSPPPSRPGPATSLHQGSQQAEPGTRSRLGPGSSSNHSSIFPSAEETLQGSTGASGWSSSVEDVQASTGESVFPADSVEALQQAEGAHSALRTSTMPWHHSPDSLCTEQQAAAYLSTDLLHKKQELRARVMPWHLSTGDLYHNQDESESSKGSASSPQLRPRSVVTKPLSGRLRDRMCRSLGADLDQLVQDEPGGGAEEGGRGGGGGSQAARLIRLHRISSSLSLHFNLSSSSLSSCSTPPRCQSLADVTEKEGGRSLPATSSCNTEDEGRSRQSQVPLEPREHTWLVKGAAGAWPDIYSLFREDPSLLNRQNFISGFTVLHWIAKHGDHRVLNTLWYGVEKAGMSFDVDARSTSGQTALHIAAIHGNKNIIRLLVTKFQANVRLRDTAGKRPWQYLSRTAPLDMFQLLAAPARAAVTGEGAGRVDSSWELQQRRRRRRHHLSSASSAQRPPTLARGTQVKRSSSIAAFLKRKSLHHFYGHHSDTPL